MARTFGIEPLRARFGATFGAVVTGVRLARIDDAAWHELYAAWLEYGLLVFPAQHLKRAEQIAFAKRFGPLEFEMAALSNVKADGSLRLEKDNDDMMKILKGNMGWHADSTYMPVQAKGAVFSAEVVPREGGRTGWADMRAAYDALDDALRAKVERLAAYHSLHYSQSKLGHSTKRPDGEYSGYGLHAGPVPLRPLVKVHPETGRKCLYLGDHAEYIVGMPYEEGRALIEELNALAIHPDLTYEHKWTVGELIVWDNRCVLHRATAYDAVTQGRVIRRCTVLGEVPA